MPRFALKPFHLDYNRIEIFSIAVAVELSNIFHIFVKSTKQGPEGQMRVIYGGIGETLKEVI